VSEQQRPLHDKLAGMNRCVEGTIQSLRRIATELRPNVLDQLGLFDALEWQLQQFHDRTGILCTYTNQIQGMTLDGDRSTDVFRVLQEALTNVARHAAATRVELQVAVHAGELIVQLRDNGHGIAEQALGDSRSIGLIGMRERMTRWGGRVHICGTPGEGTTVRVELPVTGGAGSSHEGGPDARAGRR
jgi:signal transduction histidine kinase